MPKRGPHTALSAIPFPLPPPLAHPPPPPSRGRRAPSVARFFPGAVGRRARTANRAGKREDAAREATGSCGTEGGRGSREEAEDGSRGRKRGQRKVTGVRVGALFACVRNTRLFSSRFSHESCVCRCFCSCASSLFPSPVPSWSSLPGPLPPPPSRLCSSLRPSSPRSRSLFFLATLAPVVFPRFPTPSPLPPRRFARFRARACAPAPGPLWPTPALAPGGRLRAGRPFPAARSQRARPAAGRRVECALWTHEETPRAERAELGKSRGGCRRGVEGRRKENVLVTAGVGEGGSKGKDFPSRDDSEKTGGWQRRRIQDAQRVKTAGLAHDARKMVWKRNKPNFASPFADRWASARPVSLFHRVVSCRVSPF